MGTFFEIELIDIDENKSERVIELAFSEIKRLENLLSRFKETSEIYHLNCEAENEPIKISPEIFNLIETSIKYFYLTNFNFDITIASLLALWEKSEQRGNIPSDNEIKNTLQLISSENIILDSDKRTVFFKKKGMRIDLGGIGKGYAVNRVVQILKENNIIQAMINAGGQYYVLGKYFDQEYSSIGIINPLNLEDILVKIELKDESMATSGNYERFFTIEDKKYGHIINPLTGYPGDGEVLSVSIVARNAMEADVFSTAVFLMGTEDGMKFIESHSGVEGIMVTQDNNSKRIIVNISEGLKSRVEVQ